MYSRQLLPKTQALICLHLKLKPCMLIVKNVFIYWSKNM